MDIESKKWRLVSGQFGEIEIRNKVIAKSRTATRQDLPSDQVLAIAKESTFDRICEAAYHAAR